VAGFVTGLRCARCRAEVDADRLQNMCPCGGPLLAQYDLDGIGSAVEPGLIGRRPATMWRYRELLPVRDPANAVSLGEGATPTLRLRGLGFDDLWLKDDGANPTGSFKARGAACGVTRARELGVTDAALPSAGNAGGAWAAYGAAAGMRVHVAMPRDAPAAARAEVGLFGGELQLVDGSIADAGRLIAEGVEREGWFDAATLHEPYRVEGKKTIGLEIAEDLGWRAPDVIVAPTGGGVGVIGLDLAFAQLRALGWVAGPMPRLVAVQAEGCAPIVRAYEAGAEDVEPWPHPVTLASGLRVPSPLGGALVLDAVRRSGGDAVAVSDDAIISAMTDLARSGGLWVAPEGAAGLAGIRALREQGRLDGGERIVLLNTGTGLKYPALARRRPRAVSRSRRRPS
jgi:threonine synthase